MEATLTRVNLSSSQTRTILSGLTRLKEDLIRDAEAWEEYSQKPDLENEMITPEGAKTLARGIRERVADCEAIEGLIESHDSVILEREG